MPLVWAFDSRRFTSPRWPENDRYYTAYKCYFEQSSIFTKKTLLFINRDCSSTFVFCSCVTYYNVFLSMLWLGWEFVYFATCLVGGNLAKVVILLPVFTLLLVTIVSLSRIYCRNRAHFHCVCLNHREYLIWIKFVKIPKQKFESQLVINPYSAL